MRVIFLPLLAVFLSGCAELPRIFAPQSDIPQIDQDSHQRVWRQRIATLTALQNWTLTDKVAIQTEIESWSAQIHWRQTGSDYQIRLIAPFGQGTYELRGNEAEFSIRTPDNQVLQADSPEALMQQQLQWSAPVGALSYWVRGIPGPAEEVTGLRLDEQSLLLDMQQNDWRISVLRYLNTSAVQLPGKLFMHNDHYKIRMVISKWDIQ